MKKKKYTNIKIDLRSKAIQELRNSNMTLKEFKNKYCAKWKEVNKIMVGHLARTKTTAKKQAVKARARGLEASVYKKKKGYGVSVTRK